MKMTKLLWAVVTLVAGSLFAAGELRADSTVSYTYQAGGNTFDWQMALNPTPTSIWPGYDFEITNLPFTENGIPMVGTFDFFLASQGGGFQFTVNGTFYLADALGPQIFTGSLNTPTMLAGSLTGFTDYGNGDPFTPGTPSVPGSVQGVATVPEPSTLLLMMAALATALGLAALRKS